MKQKFDISVVVPLYNEEQIIPELYTRIKNSLTQISTDYEIIFVNDGSKDHSILSLLK
jgi:dolichol-phosphate mannosyltransferase